MDLENITSYIDREGVVVDLIGLKSSKAWCFMLHGSIEVKLSLNRGHIHDKRQVLAELPTLAGDIQRTSQSVLERYFLRFQPPPRFTKFGSLNNLFEFVKNLDNSTSSGALQVTYLCLSIVFEYVQYLETADISDDQKLLLKGLLYIIYDGVVKMAGLIGEVVDAREVLIYFNECDIR